MLWLIFAGALGIAALTSLLATPRVRAIAHHIGILDETDERRMHVEPTPRIGGVAVYLGFAFALFATLGFALKGTKFYHDAGDIQKILGLLFGGTLIMAVGFWDDVMQMRPRNKLLAQIVVAAISMIYGFVIPGVEVPFTHQYLNFPLAVGIPVTLVWYLGMMNAINFLDGLDGLLTGVTAICGLFMLFIALSHGHLVAALVLCALVGSALGFLPYNFNPAKIFLGDTGSLFIGYVFATVSVIITAKVAVTVSLLVPLVVLALPIVDTAAAIVRRTRAGKRITDADRGHFHHVLVLRFGLNVRQAVLLIYAMCLVLGTLGLLISGDIARAAP